MTKRMSPPRVATSTGALTGVTTSYSTSKRHTISLGSWPDGSPFIGNIDNIKITCSSIAGGAKEVHYMISSDADGDEGIADSENGTLTVGTTTGTDGYVVYIIDIITKIKSDDTCYVFYKTDAGSVTVDECQIFWYD